MRVGNAPGSVTYTHPETGEAIPLPYTQKEALWPALYAVLSPVCLQVAEGIKILHSTSDILGITEKDGQLEMTVFGDRDMMGEMVFEGNMVKDLSLATIDGNTVPFISDGKRFSIIYSHKHKEEMQLRLSIKL